METQNNVAALVGSLQNGDERLSNKILQDVIPKLEQYLQIRMGAEFEMAKECAQQALLNVYEQILKGNIRNENSIYSYLIRASKHEYLRVIKREKKFMDRNYDIDSLTNTPEQIDRLLDKERMSILSECLQELDEESREFITYFINNPEVSSKAASKHFNITSTNLRTRKSRITKELHARFKVKQNGSSEMNHYY